MPNELLAQVNDTFTNTFGSFSTDVLTFLILFAVFYSVGVFIGRAKLCALMIAMYISSVLFTTFPFTHNITLIRNVPNALAWSGLINYLVILAITFWFTSRVVRSHEWFGTERWIYTGSYALIGVFLSIGLAYTVLPFSKILVFTETLSGFFHQPIVLFAFLLIPLISIYMSKDY